jgi:two-component system NtrC family sensor kinase
VAGIAHEINNPLAFVINNIFITQEELVRLEATQSDSSALSSLRKMRTRVEHMREGAARVQNLVSKLRTFSRLDEGTLKTVDIHESIESVLLFLGHKMEDRIQVERHYAAKEPLTCLAGELNQVLMNVIGNAIDSIDGTGTIHVCTGERDGQFVITVRDSGKGIPQEIRDRIFDPFFTTKPIGSGTGLGLSISYGIVKAHHGSIEFSSEEGKGTAFTVKIPTSLQAEVSA